MRPAVGWARPDPARTAAAAGTPAAAGTDDPEIALLAAEGADTHGLDPTAALRLIPTDAAAPDSQRTAASANSNVQPPLPSPPPQGGRGQENQRHALGGLAIDGGRVERLRANLPPGADPEARPAVGWARPDAARTAAAAAETGTDDPEIALLAAEGIYRHGLDPTAAQRYAHDQALAEGREWYLRLKVDEPATGYKDHNNVLGQLLTAKDGYDPADLGELPPYAKPYLLLVFPRPAWGEDAGDYSSDYRTAPPIGLRSWPRSGLPPADWRFEVRADRPNTPVVVNWEGPAAIVERSRLIDLATGQTLNPRAYPQGYPVTLTAGTRAFVWRYLGQPTLMTPRREIPGPIPKDIR